MMKKLAERIIAIVFAAAVMFFILTFSIGLPIYCRSFYYAQIDSLELPEQTGFSDSVIREAYDELLDYLTRGRDFGTGALYWSESGKAHFEDCKILFDLDRNVLFVSAAAIAVCVLLSVFCTKQDLRKSLAIGGLLSVGIPLCLGIIAFCDFDRAFSLFHSLLFPGKTNWVFDPLYDQIILILPERFFMNCGLLILCSVLVLAAVAVVSGLSGKRRKRNGSLPETQH